MKALQPYLNFNGNARDAMTFYHKAFGGELEMRSFAESNVPSPPGKENQILHAKLSRGSVVLMASDSPEMPVTTGSNVWISIDCESIDEIESLFKTFSDGAKVAMPLADQFWGARFGMLTDRFGVNWMFNCEKVGSRSA